MARYGTRTQIRRAPRSSRGRRSSTRRTNVWVRKVAPAVATVPGWKFALADATYIDPGAVVGSTVVRVRGNVNIIPTPSASPVFQHQVTIGVAIADYESDDIDPYNESNTVDWLFWAHVPMSQLASKAIVTGADPTVGWDLTYEFDVKSSRRIFAPQMEPVMYLKPSTGFLAVYQIASSTLLKLG